MKHAGDGTARCAAWPRRAKNGMDMSAAPRRATYDDLIAVPDHLVAEIIDGELFTSPRPATPHARAGSAIGSDLFGGFDGPPGGASKPGGWWILDEPELHLGQDVLVPDIAGWRIERMPAIPNVVGITLAPDWVCEVISPEHRPARPHAQDAGLRARGRGAPLARRSARAHARGLLARDAAAGPWRERTAATRRSVPSRSRRSPLDMGRWWMPA